MDLSSADKALRWMRRDEKPHARFEGIAILWIAFSSVWTILLVAGMAFLYSRRDMPILRIRGLLLSFGSVILLHLYWLAVQWVYVVALLFPPAVEFWIMSIWLPFGIALFHASNSRFLYVAKSQKNFFVSNNARPKSERVQKRGLIGRYSKLNYTNRMLVLVGLVSRKFHDSFGIPGTEVTGTESQRKTAARKGWEWWPSIVWQLVWAWVIAPVILWKSRNIRDTQGWRVQTIACCLANLHAAPMWLIALYLPAMAPVNNVFVPPQWIALSIMIIEVFTIFLPCWEVLRHQSLRQETLDIISQWESKKKTIASGSAKSVSTRLTIATGLSLSAWSKGESMNTFDSSETIFTMGALECMLERNPEPLQQFSALRDFSGENIAFLRAVAEWKSSLPASFQGSSNQEDSSAIHVLIHERFNSALRIYTTFISTRDAEFQVNLSSHDLKKLESIFEASARTLYGDKRAVDPALPFESFIMTSRANLNSSAASAHGSEDGIFTTSREVTGNALWWGDIPEHFDGSIFDDAEASIKYLVLTNTWPKFVKVKRKSLESMYN
ncbi:hypothetical protein F53441_8124 [Fusarium austroafricanum]|uniref:RGS domain-containing protein n=1 Tax=Fusarium austroafricanum TaxID=2364996 RepID=A0A8H4NRH1_9HYPO|nr:hypothetical protein F53441_8124 [Fusarium austroafricanum]